MELKCKLIEKAFKSDDGESRNYYVLSFELADGSNLEVTIKSDKAKLLKLSNNLNENTMPEFNWNK